MEVKQITEAELAHQPCFYPESLCNKEILLVCAPVALARVFPLDWLDAYEKQRMMGYRFSNDRQRHHLAHALKRWVLGQLLDLPPEKLIFQINAQGKPSLVNEFLQFNLSHSGNWVVIAVRKHAPVGVDVEVQRSFLSDFPWPSILHPDDEAVADINSFLRAWTLKEAVSKCTGEGLQLDFKRLHLYMEKEGRTDCLHEVGCRRWQAWHGIFDNGNAHLSVASNITWSQIEKWCLVPRFLEQYSTMHLTRQCTKLLAECNAEVTDIGIA